LFSSFCSRGLKPSRYTHCVHSLPLATLVGILLLAAMIALYYKRVE